MRAGTDGFCSLLNPQCLKQRLAKHSVKYFQPDPSAIIHAECMALYLTYQLQSGLNIISNFLFRSGSTSLNTHGGWKIITLLR